MLCCVATKYFSAPSGISFFVGVDRLAGILESSRVHARRMKKGAKDKNGSVWS
jgi:hypothetical protein